MPRTEARIKTSIWTDEDWLKLSSSAKYLYLTILSQATLNLCGCIAQTKSSWSFATKMTLKMVNKSLLELKREKFIIVDDTTEELLVRSFIRNDGVLTKPNVIVAMSKDYLTIRSKAIRQAVIDEIPEGFIASLPERFPKPFAEGFLERLPEGFLEGLGEGLPEPSRAHSSILHPPSSILHPPTTNDSRKPSNSASDYYEQVRKSSTKTANAVEPKKRNQDLLFEQLLIECGMQNDALTKNERGRINFALKQLREIGATVEEIKDRSNSYRTRWPNIDLTASALISNWSLLSKKTPTQQDSTEELMRQLEDF